MFKLKECQGLKLDYDNLDKILGSEDRTVNEYFGIYKLSLLVIGGSGAGKSTWILNMILSNKIKCDCIILILPQESANSGLYKKLIEHKAIQCQNGKIIKIASFIINKDQLPTIKELQKANLKNPCIIIDDWINSVNRNDFNLIKQYTTQISRVSGCTLCVLVQNYKKLDITFRSNFTIFVLFLSNVHKPVYQNTIENLFNGNITKEQEEKLYEELKGIKYKPLILINGADDNKNMIFDDCYILTNVNEYIETY